MSVPPYPGSSRISPTQPWFREKGHNSYLHRIFLRCSIFNAHFRRQYFTYVQYFCFTLAQSLCQQPHEHSMLWSILNISEYFIYSNSNQNLRLCILEIKQNSRILFLTAQLSREACPCAISGWIIWPATCLNSDRVETTPLEMRKYLHFPPMLFCIQDCQKSKYFFAKFVYPETFSIIIRCFRENKHITESMRRENQ